jgi:hypothetical protein
MKLIFDLLIGDLRLFVGVVASLLLAWLAVRAGSPELAGFLLLLGVLVTHLGVTWLKSR